MGLCYLPRVFAILGCESDSVDSVTRSTSELLLIKRDRVQSNVRPVGEPIEIEDE